MRRHNLVEARLGGRRRRAHAAGGDDWRQGRRQLLNLRLHAGGAPLLGLRAAVVGGAAGRRRVCRLHGQLRDRPRLLLRRRRAVRQLRALGARRCQRRGLVLRGRRRDKRRAGRQAAGHRRVAGRPELRRQQRRRQQLGGGGGRGAARAWASRGGVRPPRGRAAAHQRRGAGGADGAPAVVAARAGCRGLARHLHQRGRRDGARRELPQRPARLR